MTTNVQVTSVLGPSCSLSARFQHSVLPASPNIITFWNGMLLRVNIIVGRDAHYTDEIDILYLKHIR